MILLDKALCGRTAEIQACTFLQQQGLQLLAKNFRSPFGEIDLVMRQQDYIVFVEVRYRSLLNYGTPVESVSLSKQRRLLKTAYCYLQQQSCARHLNYRFDVIGISGKTDETALQWVKNAFEVGW